MIVVDDRDADGVLVVSPAGRVLGTSEGLAPERIESALEALREEHPEGMHVVDAVELERARELAELHFAEDITADYIAAIDGRLLAANPAFIRMFGFESEDDACRHNLTDLHPSDQARDAFLSALFESGRLRGYRSELRNLSGRALHVVQNVVLDRSVDGEPLRLRGYMLDRTAERQLEDQLLRWQRLEAVGRLAGGVAHDFNNLLTVILSYAQMLERQLPDGSRSREMVAEMYHAGERAAELTRRLLAFGRRQSLRSQTIDVNELVRRMLPLLQSVVGEAVELDLVLAQSLGIVSGDAGQLEQVIMNLVVNARDAMPIGGKLTIETETVLVDTEYRKTHPWASIGRYVLVSITDTGAGMPRDVLDHLFEPFFTTKGTGTGLGLASAYGIVKQHGGMIHAYSEESVGTTVKVYLPIAARPAISVGPKLKRRTPGGTETVLIAEDEPTVRAVLVRLLKDRGYEVIEALSGEEALDALGKHPEIQLCVLDVVMPGMGGIAAYERLRDLHPVMPVILTSGYSGELASERFADDPHAHFVPKPYSPDTMLDRVRRSLDEVLSDSDVG